MKIDGVSLVEPSPADDPTGMGPVAVVIDCDLDALAQKMQQEVPVKNFKTMFGGANKACFSGKTAVDWCLQKDLCSDEIDAIHLLNRMLERGLLHHCRLSKLVEPSDTAYYRFPQDHFKVLVDQTGAQQSVRRRLRPNSKTLRGEAALKERWYADVPTLPSDKVRKHGRVLQRLQPRDVTRGLRRYPMVFQGKEAVELLIDTGKAKDTTDALAIGNAFLRAGLFHQVNLRAPLRNDETLYRLAENQFAILVSRDQVWGSSYHGGTSNARYSSALDDSRVGTVISGSDLGDALETKGRSALELATASRYWTSYRASKLYVVNLTVVEGFIDMSEDWDHHVDEMFPTYCECYLTRDKEATTHSTIRSHKTLHPVWNCPVAFVDVDYLDVVRIDLKAQTQLGQDTTIGSIEFDAHEVMGSNGNRTVVEFDCGSQQFADCAAAIIKVEFDPAVAVSVDTPGFKQHHLLTTGERLRDDIMYSADRSRGSRPQNRRSMRGSVRRTSLAATAEDMDPVFINVEGSSGCVLLDDDSAGPRRVGSFSNLPLNLLSSHGGSVTSSLHSLPTLPWLDGLGAAGGVNGQRPSYTSSDARRGSTQSDLPDILEDNEFHEQGPHQEPFPAGGTSSKNNLYHKSNHGGVHSGSNGLSSGAGVSGAGSNGNRYTSQRSRQQPPPPLPPQPQQQQEQKTNVPQPQPDSPDHLAAAAAAAEAAASNRRTEAVGNGGGGSGSGSSTSTTSNGSSTCETTRKTNRVSNGGGGGGGGGGIKPRGALPGPGPSRALHGGGDGTGAAAAGGEGNGTVGTGSGGGAPADGGASASAVSGASAAAMVAAARQGRRTSFDPAVLRKDEARGARGGGDGLGGAAVGRGGSDQRAERRLTFGGTSTSSDAPARAPLRQ